MKKVIWLLVMLSVCSISYAESMKFITVLSSAVGTFNKLEAVDPEKPAEGKKVVNFCTSIGTEGKVELKGTNPAKLNTVALADTTTLGRRDETGKGKYSLTKIELNQGGNIKGGRLFGNTFSVNNAASGKADNLYGNELTVTGAKTKSLEITGASHITAQHAEADMVWSNEYQDDEACKSGSACAKQYLLKEKGGTIETPEGDCSDHSYKLAHKSECCPGTPTTDTDCWIKRYVWSELKYFDYNVRGTFSAVGAEIPAQCAEFASATNMAKPHSYPEYFPEPLSGVISCNGVPFSEEAVSSIPNGGCGGPVSMGLGSPLPKCLYNLPSSWFFQAFNPHNPEWHGKVVEFSRGECTVELNAPHWPGHECVESEPIRDDW